MKGIQMLLMIKEMVDKVKDIELLGIQELVDLSDNIVDS
jgi:hypothetical protein